LLVDENLILHIRSPGKADKYIITDKAGGSQELIDELKSITPMTGDDSPKSVMLSKIPYVRCHRKPHKCKAKIIIEPKWNKTWIARKTQFRSWESYIHEAKAYGRIVLSGNDPQRLSAVVYLPELYTNSLDILDKSDEIIQERSKRLMQELSKQGISFQDTLTPLSSGEYGICEHPAKQAVERMNIKGKVRLTSKARDGIEAHADNSGHDYRGNPSIEVEYGDMAEARRAVLVVNRVDALFGRMSALEGKTEGVLSIVERIVGQMERQAQIADRMPQGPALAAPPQPEAPPQPYRGAEFA
jgi:hypothetical protein